MSTSLEDKAGEKVVEFLATHLFGRDRIEVLKQSLAEVDPERTARMPMRSVCGPTSTGSRSGSAGW